MQLHEGQEVLKSGDAENFEKAVIMIHGRGATAHSILQLEKKLPKALYYAPQAANNTWYPRSFMNPVEDNQPYLDSALKKVYSLVEELKEKGFEQEDIFLLGFSQGACLASEYVARNPGKYGGLIVFSGGVIGETVKDYSGSMENTPVFIGCSDNDPHIPLERVNQTEQVFKEMDANVEKHVFEGSFHGITDYELEQARKIINDSDKTNQYQ